MNPSSRLQASDFSTPRGTLNSGPTPVLEGPPAGDSKRLHLIPAGRAPEITPSRTTRRDLVQSFNLAATPNSGLLSAGASGPETNGSPDTFVTTSDRKSTEPDEQARQLAELYHTWVPSSRAEGQPLTAAEVREQNALALLQRLNVNPQDLKKFIDTLKTWQAGRAVAQGTTVFAFGFLMLGVFHYLKAAEKVSFGEKDMDRLLTFITGSVIAGVGGTFGSRIIDNGGLAPTYFKALHQKGNEFVDATKTNTGKALEYSAFWTFAVGHAIVEWQCANSDPETKAMAKLLSACAATLGTCLHKAYLPRFVHWQDPTALLGGNREKDKETTTLIDSLRDHQHSRLSPCNAALDYLSGWFGGLKNTLSGCPSYAIMTRALWHTVAAAVTLAPGALAPVIAGARPEVKRDAAVAGAAWIGISWGYLSGLGRRVVADIEKKAVPNSRQAAADVAPRQSV